jgi:hypothetical protein
MSLLGIHHQGLAIWDPALWQISGWPFRLYLKPWWRPLLPQLSHSAYLENQYHTAAPNICHQHELHLGLLEPKQQLQSAFLKAGNESQERLSREPLENTQGFHEIILPFPVSRHLIGRTTLKILTHSQSLFFFDYQLTFLLTSLASAGSAVLFLALSFYDFSLLLLWSQ